MRLTPALLWASLVLSAETFSIRNVTITDSDGARSNCSVSITGARISSVACGGRQTVRSGDIDGRGKFLIPALWDMHVHLWGRDPMLNLYVATGVLGVRDMGSDLVRTKQSRADVKSGKILGPQIYTSGDPIDGPTSQMKQTTVMKVSTPDEARHAVDVIEQASADFIKIYSGLTSDEYQAVAQRARVIRMPFAGHLPESVSADEAIDARQKSIEHLFGIALSCSPLESTLRARRAEAIRKGDAVALAEIRKRTYQTFSEGAANQLFHRMARFGVWQTPTLVLRQRMDLMNLDRLVSAPELRYVPEPVRKTWTDPRSENPNIGPEQLTAYREDYEFQAKLVKLIHGSGAGLLAGTDTGDSFVVPGFSLHAELEALVGAGLTPQEAIKTATLAPAQYFGIESEQGSVARGRVANLVLLNANPLSDIRNTRKISAVVLNGHLLGRKCLDELLEGRSQQCPSMSAIPAPQVPAARHTTQRWTTRTRRNKPGS